MRFWFLNGIKRLKPRPRKVPQTCQFMRGCQATNQGGRKIFLLNTFNLTVTQLRTVKLLNLPFFLGSAECHLISVSLLPLYGWVGRLCRPVPFIINHELQYASMNSGQLIADGSFSLNQSLTGVIQLHQDFCSKMDMSHSDLWTHRYGRSSRDKACAGERGESVLVALAQY